MQSMLASCKKKELPPDNDRYVRSAGIVRASDTAALTLHPSSRSATRRKARRTRDGASPLIACASPARLTLVLHTQGISRRYFRSCRSAEPVLTPSDCRHCLIAVVVDALFAFLPPARPVPPLYPSRYPYLCPTHSPRPSHSSDFARRRRLDRPLTDQRTGEARA